MNKKQKIFMKEVRKGIQLQDGVLKWYQFFEKIRWEAEKKAFYDIYNRLLDMEDDE